MNKKHNVSDYMWWTERKPEDLSFSEKLVWLNKRLYTHVFRPINDVKSSPREMEAIDLKVRGDFVEDFGNSYNNTMNPYENGNIDQRFGEFYADFKKQLDLLCERVERYINDEQYRESRFVHMIVEGLFKLNEEFYNLNEILKKDGYNERLMDVMLQSSINNDEMGQIHTFPYIETEQGKKRREEYEQKIDQVKRLWIGIYHFLMQLMDKELGALLANEDEESFRNWLKTSYIWEQVKWVEYWENFSRSHSILKHKHEEILKQLSELKKCFDEKGNLKDEAKIPALDDISILKISKGDRRKYNKGKMKERFTRLIRWMQKTEGSNKEK